jgi:hypothetical protein
MASTIVFGWIPLLFEPTSSRWLDPRAAAGTFILRRLCETVCDAPILAPKMAPDADPPHWFRVRSSSLKSLDRSHFLALMLPVVSKAPSDPLPNEPVG